MSDEKFVVFDDVELMRLLEDFIVDNDVVDEEFLSSVRELLG